MQSFVVRQRFALTGLVLAPMLALASVAPALAESQGWRFLEAVRKKDGETVEKMLNVTGGKDTPGSIIINTRDIVTGDSALHVVIGQRNYQWLEYLIAKGADVNIRNSQGTTPLWLAINSAFSDGASLLIVKGARINDPGPAGETPLIAAVHQKNTDLARTLVKAGADPLRADNSGRNALDYARLAGLGTMTTELEIAAKAIKAKQSKSYGPSF